MRIERFTGYLHASYAESLSEWGAPRRLSNAASWAIERNIPGSDRLDAAGCYPLMACGNWACLVDDFRASERNWVTFTAVPDPLGAPEERELLQIFCDHVRPFKTHHLVELTRWTGPSKAQHRRRVRLSEPHVETEVAPARPELLEQWIDLYAALVARHAIQGMRQFSRRSFTALFAVPGLHVARAIARDETVAMSLWFSHDQNAYYHLGASSTTGYALNAAYPMFNSAIRYLRDLGFEWLDLGGGAGVTEGQADGLVRFKQGWATAERTAWLCGRILDPAAYRALTTGTNGEYFPAYRAAEFI